MLYFMLKDKVRQLLTNGDLELAVGVILYFGLQLTVYCKPNFFVVTKLTFTPIFSKLNRYEIII
ncbi:MAG: hypothetical protein ACD_72C00368G0003 [uncultured bacterium]|nr:MAG: hypothetical protein ACD_72C00368G0003 [uncultured bacterium]